MNNLNNLLPLPVLLPMLGAALTLLLGREGHRIVVASAESGRQTRALAQNVHDKVKEAGGEIIGTEGQDTGEWVLVDLGGIVVHVMQAAVRSYYNLEELWGAAPARPGRPGGLSAHAA